MAKLSEYQKLKKAGQCTRGCGSKGELNRSTGKRKSECRKCRDNSHGKQ